MTQGLTQDISELPYFSDALVLKRWMAFEVIWQFDVVHNAVQSAESGGEYVWGMYGGEANKTCNPNILFPHLIMQHSTGGIGNCTVQGLCNANIWSSRANTSLAEREDPC